MNIIIKQEMNTKKIATDYETLRLNANNITIKHENFNTQSINKIINMDYMILGLYLDNELAAGIYISNALDSVFIEQLFVKKRYQETGLNLGKMLLLYLLNNLNLFTSFFNNEYQVSYLFYLNEKSKYIYESIGYQEIEPNNNFMKKELKTK